MLNSPTKWGLVLEDGASPELGMELANAGITGTLSREKDPDTSLHGGDHPQHRYTTSHGRNFTISQTPEGKHLIADADHRENDAYMQFGSNPGDDDIAASVRAAKRFRIAWDHAPSEELRVRETNETAGLVMRSCEVRDDASVHSVLVDDDGHEYAVAFDTEKNRIIATSLDGGAHPELADGELLEALGSTITETDFHNHLDSVRFDPDTDLEMYDAIANAKDYNFGWFSHIE